jgi:hypothetical protein
MVERRRKNETKIRNGGGLLYNNFFRRKEGKTYLIALLTLPKGGVCV